MLPDFDSSDISAPDIVFSSDFAGLEIYQCENWTIGPAHGGNISSIQIFDGEGVIFPRVTRVQNQEGMKQYVKTFWKNTGTDSWDSIAPVIVQDASLTFPRESITLAIGAASDTMLNKPNDSEFSYQPSAVNVVPGESISVWIRQIITPGGSNAELYSDVPCVIQLQEV